MTSASTRRRAIQSLAFSPDGKTLAAGFHDQQRRRRGGSLGPGRAQAPGGEPLQRERRCSWCGLQPRRQDPCRGRSARGDTLRRRHPQTAGGDSRQEGGAVLSASLSAPTARRLPQPTTPAGWYFSTWTLAIAWRMGFSSRTKAMCIAWLSARTARPLPRVTVIRLSTRRGRSLGRRRTQASDRQLPSTAWRASSLA